MDARTAATGEPPLGVPSTLLVYGYGLHGRAVVEAATRRGFRCVVADDRPGADALAHARARGVEIVVRPEATTLADLVRTVGATIPTPGLPETHALFAEAAAAGVPVLGELDLAAAWDSRPIVAITGTNGKTTVTTLVTEMLNASGVAAMAAGNTDLALVEAIADPSVQIFVVEASSFRLALARRFRPVVGTWLNFAPDHLDVHRSLESYADAKARIWRDQRPDDVAIANAEDPVVMSHHLGEGRRETFGLDIGDNRVVDGSLIVGGRPLVAVDELARRLPHDLANALAAATTALAAGADRAAVAAVLRTFGGLEHRVQRVAESHGIGWYDDSKATTPHAVIAGVSGFASVVLIAGGRNKGVDLTPLATLAPRLRGVVAIGDAAAEIEATFAGLVPVRTAESMAAAVAAAAGLAVRGDAVVLSPACTSYDWYSNYGERGDDFVQCVHAFLGGTR